MKSKMSGGGEMNKRLEKIKSLIKVTPSLLLFAASQDGDESRR